MSVLDLDEHAERVIWSLDPVGTETLRALSKALDLAGYPLAYFSDALLTVALDREGGEGPSVLSRLQWRTALRSVAYDETLVERLQGVEEPPFWVAVRDAVSEIADATN